MALELRIFFSNQIFEVEPYSFLTFVKMLSTDFENIFQISESMFWIFKYTTISLAYHFHLCRDFAAKVVSLTKMAFTLYQLVLSARASLLHIKQF